MDFERRWNNLNPYELHKTLINEYFFTTKNNTLIKRDTSKDKTDIDVIKENHQFLWEDEEEGNISWEKRLAKRYYDKLYKEYCIGDLSRYKENKIGMRWRTEQELIDGKGQFSCGNKKCKEENYLKTWEVNFGYIEHGIKKNALVKLRLCPCCSYKLNYHSKKKELKRLKYSHNRKREENSLHIVKDKKQGKVNETFKTGEEMEIIKGKSNAETSDVGKQNNAETSDVWKQNNAEEDAETKTREEEFDEYLDQLFL